MKISSKLILLAGGVTLLFLAQGLIFLHQIQIIERSYTALLDGRIREAETCRTIEIDFKEQVDRWKDVLLRGHHPEDLERYTREYYQKDAAVRAQAQGLADTFKDSEVRIPLEQFLAAHQRLDENYQAAYRVFLTKQFDHKAADAMVRGQAQALTKVLDGIVDRLDARVREAVASETTAARRIYIRAMLVFVIMLAIWGFTALLVIRNILRRIHLLKLIGDRLAVGDVDHLEIDIPGDDEIGELVHAASRIHNVMKGLVRIVECVSRDL